VSRQQRLRQNPRAFMNDLFLSLGIESWKPVLAALLLPPVPLLLLVLLGTSLVAARRGAGWLVVWVALIALWLCASVGIGEAMQRAIGVPPPLGRDDVSALRRDVVTAKQGVALVVLGGGREALAPEYGVASLSGTSLERLRYGLWLSRETGAPVMVSGGLGHAAQPGPSEAEVAGAIASREFGRPLRWLEGESRDTRENARLSTAALRNAGITKLVLVTHGWQMPRALRAFREAAVRADAPWEVVAAPMALAPRIEHPVLRWMPSAEGFELVRAIVRERIGWWMGA
jgi:uncharacterized SAM-binding protein YcdF (DUF218 family)